MDDTERDGADAACLVFAMSRVDFLESNDPIAVDG